MDVIIVFLSLIKYSKKIVIIIDSINQISLTITRSNGEMNSFLINSSYDISNSDSTTITTINLAIFGTYPNSNVFFLFNLILNKKGII